MIIGFHNCQMHPGVSGPLVSLVGPHACDRCQLCIGHVVTFTDSITLTVCLVETDSASQTRRYSLVFLIGLLVVFVFLFSSFCLIQAVH